MMTCPATRLGRSGGPNIGVAITKTIHRKRRLEMSLFLGGARLWNRRFRLGLLLLLALVSVAGLSLVGRVPLGAGYHDFADKRTLLGIPNCLDVLSNLPFFLVGVWGAVWVLRQSNGPSFVEKSERIPYVVFFFGVALTGVGSFWYHLAPDNQRLPWDLLPMTFSFTSVVTATIVERVSARVGYRLYVPMLVFGAASVAYWYFTEAQGRGDYRFYLFVQFFSPVLLAAIVWLFPPRYTSTGYLVFAFGLFVLAKLMETFDRQIYAAVGVVSGHALKHATAGVACYWVLLALQRRHPIPGFVEADPATPVIQYGQRVR